MGKLVSADYMRLKKDKFFWIGFLFMAGAGIFFPVMRYLDAKETGTVNNIDNGFFACALFIGIIMAVFCSLFIGTEYSDGTIRNKVIIGHSRTAVYLANLIVCGSVSLALCIAFFLPYLCIGIPLLGTFDMDLKMVLLFSLAVFALAVTFSSVFLLVSMLNQNRAVTAVICILLAFLLLFAGAYLNKMLSEQKTNMGIKVTEKGQEYEEIPNPRYLMGGERKMVQFLYDVIPGGQAIQCAFLEAVNVSVFPVYSLIIILATSGTGLYCFRKKDLK